MNHVCLVCGYPDLEHAPRGREGGGSFEICPCCGYQYGVDDDDRQVTPEAWRAGWVKEGMLWWSRGIAAPEGWDARAQLRTVIGMPASDRVRGQRPKPDGFE